MNDSKVEYLDAAHDDLARVQEFLEPFMNGRHLLERTSIEMELLLKHAFIAQVKSRIVGFAALEIYSKKLAEIQCLAVSPDYQRRGVGRKLVGFCINRAREQKIGELMAISSSDEMFRACGFDYSLPNQKRALFIQPGNVL